MYTWVLPDLAAAILSHNQHDSTLVGFPRLVFFLSQMAKKKKKKKKKKKNYNGVELFDQTLTRGCA
jgi:hypothetical protein